MRAKREDMIRLVNFVKKYGKGFMLKADDICFENNKISFLMAPNGAGKTTLLKCISALEEYDGEISINDKKNTDNLSECLIVWDDCPFFNNLSGLKNLQILSEDKANKKEIRSVARMYIDDDLLKRRVRTYSYGQRKKLALVLAQILNPSVLIMDEISNGLDFDTMQELQDKLKKLSENCTIILTGHQLGFYDKLYDDLFIIKDNEIVKADLTERKSLEEVYREKLH